MKCIKLIRQSKGRELGEIMRTSDSDAELRVKGGNWIFIPKSEWKDYRGKPKKTEQVSDEITTKRSKKSDGR
jgi:hypothetical protein